MFVNKTSSQFSNKTWMSILALWFSFDSCFVDSAILGGKKSVQKSKELVLNALQGQWGSEISQKQSFKKDDH